MQVTPVVVGGIMYVSDANECYALDAGTGRQIWHYRRPPTPGLASAMLPAVRIAAWLWPATGSSWRRMTRI